MVVLTIRDYALFESAINPTTQARNKLKAARHHLERGIDKGEIARTLSDEAVWEAYGALLRAEELTEHARGLMRECIEHTKERFPDE